MSTYKDSLVCDICGQTFHKNAGHCRGGRFGGCCRSFDSTRDFDRHRTGSYENSTRRCYTDAELLEKGWVTTPEGRWVSPATIRERAAGAAKRAKELKYLPP